MSAINNKFRIAIEPQTDRNGKTYYMGKFEAPVNIKCRKGAVFMVFISEQGCEEIQISVPKSPTSNSSRSLGQKPVVKHAKIFHSYENTHFDLEDVVGDGENE